MDIRLLLNTTPSAPAPVAGPHTNQAVTHWVGSGVVPCTLHRQGPPGSQNWGVNFGNHFVPFKAESANRVRQLQQQPNAAVQAGMNTSACISLDTYYPLHRVSAATVTLGASDHLSLDIQAFEQQPSMQAYGNSFRNFIMQYAQRGHFPAPRVTTGTHSPLPRLPAEMWLETARYLPVADRKNLRLVSQKFSRTGASSIERVKICSLKDVEGLHSFPAAKKITLSGAAVTPTLLQAAIRIAPDIAELDLHNCPNLTDADLQSIGQQLGSLTHLNIKNCPHITGTGLQRPQQAQQGPYFPALTHLDLAGMRIANAHLQDLHRFGRLTHLDLSNCTAITRDGLQHLSRVTTLTHLDLSNCYRIRDDGLPHLSRLNQLQHLNLQGCDQIRSAGLLHVGQLHNLAYLNLSCCSGIRDDGLQNLSPLTNLTHLELAECDEISDTGLQHVANLVNLTQLNLTKCVQITDTGLRHLGALTRMERLDLSNCGNISNTGLAHLAPMAGTLTHLSLHKCRRLSNPCVQNLQPLTNLTHLDLSDVLLLTDNALQHFVSYPNPRDRSVKTSRFPRLTSLDLSDCTRITSIAALDVLSTLKSLHLGNCRKLSNLVSLQYMHELEHLDLHDCPNIHNDPVCLGHLNSNHLKYLDISQTHFHPQQLRGLARLTSLESLVATGLRLGPGTLQHIGCLTGLKTLDLSSTYTYSTDLHHLQSLTKLKNLVMAHAHRAADDNAQLGLTFLPHLTSLVSLDLTSCDQVGLRDLPNLSQLRNLERLHLTRCRLLTDAVLQQYTQSSPHLSTLDIAGCENVTDISVPALLSLSGLTHVNVARTSITGQGANRLRTQIARVTGPQ